MAYWILPASGIPISCSTVQYLTYLEQQTDEWKQSMAKHDDKLMVKWNAESAPIVNNVVGADHPHLIDLQGEDGSFLEEYHHVIDDSKLMHVEDMYDSEYGREDPYIHMELGMPKGDESELMMATVKKRAVDVEGQPMGKANVNPLSDTREYEVEYVSGKKEILTTDIITANLLSQVDEEGP